MIKKAFLNNIYLQRIHGKNILDMYTFLFEYKESLQTAEYICKTNKAIHSNFKKKW